MITFDVAGQGKPLVLLHGVGASRGIWRPVIPRLSADRLVLAPDLPGFGDSPPVGPGFGVEETADALAGVLRGQVSEPVDLLGNSLGGAVALLLALRHAELVHRLVLVAPAGFSPWSRPVSSAIARLSSPALTYRRVIGSPLAGSGIARRVMLYGTVAAPQRLSAQDTREVLQASRRSSRVGEAMAAVLEADLQGALAGLASPLGLIWGERDRVIPIATLESILAICPEAVVETIPDAAHVPQLERPGEFVAALISVLERL